MAVFMVFKSEVPQQPHMLETEPSPRFAIIVVTCGTELLTAEWNLREGGRDASQIAVAYAVPFCKKARILNLIFFVRNLDYI